MQGRFQEEVKEFLTTHDLTFASSYALESTIAKLAGIKQHPTTLGSSFESDGFCIYMKGVTEADATLVSNYLMALCKEVKTSIKSCDETPLESLYQFMVPLTCVNEILLPKFKNEFAQFDKEFIQRLLTCREITEDDKQSMRAQKILNEIFSNAMILEGIEDVIRITHAQPLKLNEYAQGCIYVLNKMLLEATVEIEYATNPDLRLNLYHFRQIANGYKEIINETSALQENQYAKKLVEGLDLYQEHYAKVKKEDQVAHASPSSLGMFSKQNKATELNDDWVEIQRTSHGEVSYKRTWREYFRLQ